MCRLTVFLKKNIRKWISINEDKCHSRIFCVINLPHPINTKRFVNAKTFVDRVLIGVLIYDYSNLFYKTFNGNGFLYHKS